MKRSTTALATVLALTAASANAADLRMSWWGGDSRHAATQEALKVCGEKHGHTISPEFGGWTGHFEKLTTQIAGRTEADIMQVNWPWLPIYSANGEGFADLRELSDIIDLSQWSEAELASGSQNGKLNGLPISTSGRLFVFNTTTWEEAGLSLPTSWDDLMAAGPVFAEKLRTDHYPLEGIGLDAAMLVTNVCTQMTGKPLIDSGTNEISWSIDEMTAAIEFYGKMVENHVLVPWKEMAAGGNVPLHENPNWTSGKIAGTYQWDTTYFKISDPMQDGEKIAYHKLLTMGGQKTEGIYRKPSMTFAISKNSEDQEAAAQIVNCMLNEEEGVKALGSTRGVPASDAAFAILEADGAIAPVQIEAGDLVMNATGPAIHPFMEHPDVRSAMQDNLEAFAYGQMTAAEAAEEILYGIQEVLDDNIDS